VFGSGLEAILRPSLPDNLPDLASQCSVALCAWQLMRITAEYRRATTRFAVRAAPLLAGTALVIVYTESDDLHEHSDTGLLSTTGPHAQLYLAAYASTVITTAALIVRRAAQIRACVLPGTSIHRHLNLLLAGARTLLAYGLTVLTFIGFDADTRIPRLGISWINLSWWIASAAMILLAAAGLTGTRPMTTDRRRPGCQVRQSDSIATPRAA
jgi:hypothetical protein